MFEAALLFFSLQRRYIFHAAVIVAWESDKGKERTV
jgi:hypothetical protein